MPEQQNERPDSHELTDITPVRGNTPRRGNNEVTYPTPMRGNNEVTYPTPMRGNNEATFITPLPGGNNELTYTTPARGNNESTYPTPVMGNNELTYTAPARGNNERTFITATEKYNEPIDLIITRPIPAVPAPSSPHGLSINRRKLLLGGGATLLALLGGGAALTALNMALNNTGQHSSTTTPTVVPKPRDLVPGKNVLTIAAHSDTVTNVAWDPTGRYLASSSVDNSIKLWDVGNMVQKQTANPLTLSQPTWAQTFTNTADFNFDTLHWSADGRNLVTLALDQNNHAEPFLVSPFTNDTKGQLFTNPKLQGVAPLYDTPMPAPHGTTLAAIDNIARRYHKVDLWQMSKPGAPLFSLTYQDPDQFIGDYRTLSIIGWSCDGSLLAGFFGGAQISRTRSIVVWDVKTRSVKAALPLAGLSEDMGIFRVALSWSPANPHLLAVFNLNSIAVVDASQGKILYQLSTEDPDAFQPVKPNTGRIPLLIAITWSPDGRYIAASYISSNKVYLWDTQAKNAPTKDGARLQQLIFPQANDPLAHSDSITDISWSPDGRFLATASYDKSIKVWKVDGHA